MPDFIDSNFVMVMVSVGMASAFLAIWSTFRHQSGRNTQDSIADDAFEAELIEGDDPNGVVHRMVLNNHSDMAQTVVSMAIRCRRREPDRDDLVDDPDFVGSGMGIQFSDRGVQSQEFSNLDFESGANATIRVDLRGVAAVMQNAMPRDAFYLFVTLVGRDGRGRDVPIKPRWDLIDRVASTLPSGSEKTILP